ncbi:cyanate transporter [Frondihabitans sucicola]|uniref:Cyanate transporter n=1 Tax=Frondihabitans sucicola TaxID=1268041 RepID=A0ABM8GLW5_9MICO|nr:MFS transporter [Frondihabitans sucicola]BDZ49407.1 cyanate transporter [Frondihabitans sucicola]
MSTLTARKSGTTLFLIGILLIAANLRVGITPVGPVIGEIRADLHLPASTASALTSIPLLAFAVVSPFAASLANRWGPQRTLAGALAVLALAIVIRSTPWAPSLWIGTALLGVSVAVLNVVLPALVKEEFPGRVGPVTGIYSAAQSAFAAIAAGVAVPVAAVAPGGWRTSLGLWAVLAVVALIVLAPQLRLPHHAAAVAPVGGAPARSTWRSPLAWQVTVFMGLQSTAFYVLITWLPSVELANGLTAAQAGFHQLLFSALAIAGSLGASSVLRRGDDQRVLAATSTLLVAAGIAIAMFAPPLAVIGVCVTGVGAGGAIVLALSLFGLRTRHPLQAARLSGMAQSVGYLIAAAGPIAIGLLHDATGSWNLALGVLFPLLAIQLVVGLLAARDRSL